MTKRIIALCLILALLAALTGCGTSSNQPATTQPTEPAVEIPLPDSKPIPAAEAFAGGSGTEADPYQIETAEQLALLAKYVNEENKDYNQCWYVQTADIVMNDISNVENWATEAPEWCWTPIGSKFLTDFQGHYDGDNFVISGMFVFSSRPAASEGTGDHVGLFGYVYQGSVKNVVLKNSYVFANNQSSAAGIVGQASYSQISGCVNEATVETLQTNRTGGICGDAGNETVIQNCSNAGMVSSGEDTDCVGGICGSVSSTLSNCTNSGAITGYGEVGGICGNANGAIENCRNSGAVISDPDGGFSHAGGIVGSTGENIQSCRNTGPVSGAGSVGGIVGSFSNMSVPDEDPASVILADCSNEGSITGLPNTASSSLSRIGGIVGSTTVYEGDLTIRNCINTASIHGEGEDGSAGGISGDLSSAGDCETGQGLLVENCQNTGNVTQPNLAGGIIGDCSVSKAPATIRNCSNTGIITASTSNGGIVGQLNPSLYPVTIASCENTGVITASYQGGGILGNYFGVNLEVDKPASVLISKCSNSGPVSGEYIGGIVGLGMDASATCQIEDCVNEGLISGDTVLNAGGILGSDAAAGLVGQEGPAFTVRRCVNLGDVVYGDGTLPFDNNITYRTEFVEHFDVESAAAILLGGKSIGGIVGKVNQSLIEDCVNYGKLYAQDGTIFLVTLADLASYDPESDDELMLAGAICGLYYFRDDVHNTKNMGIHDCIYADTACVGYSEFGLFEGAHTIWNVQAVSEADARAAAEKLMN